MHRFRHWPRTKKSWLSGSLSRSFNGLRGSTRIALPLTPGKEWVLNSGGQTRNVPDTACRILAYLQANPDAQDTLEGIVEWWLLDQRIRDETDRVKEALAYLTKQGLVTARIGTDSRGFKVEQQKSRSSHNASWSQERQCAYAKEANSISKNSQLGWRGCQRNLFRSKRLSLPTSTD